MSKNNETDLLAGSIIAGMVLLLPNSSDVEVRDFVLEGVFGGTERIHAITMSHLQDIRPTDFEGFNPITRFVFVDVHSDPSVARLIFGSAGDFSPGTSISVQAYQMALTAENIKAMMEYSYNHLVLNQRPVNGFD